MKKLCALMGAVCVLLLDLCFAGAEVFFDAPPRENWYQSPLLRLTAFNAAQSDCLLLECGGEAMMVDGGTEAYGDALVSALAEKDISSFKYLLNTHYHEDHISGLIRLMAEEFAAGEYLHPYAPNSIYGSALQRQAIRQAEKSGIPSRQVLHGEELLLGEATLTLIRHDEGLSTNGRSVVAQVRFGDATLLLGADIIGDTQSWMVRSLPKHLMDADVIKAPHHGVSVMAADFLQAVSPRAILFTNNRERAAEGMAQSEAKGIPSYYNNEGRVVAETDGEDWYVYQLVDSF